MAINGAPATLSVQGHLPLSWRPVSSDEAEALRSHVLDLAVTRSWRTTFESAPPDMDDGTRYLLQRLQRMEEKVDRLSRAVRGQSDAALEVRPLRLGPESVILRPAEGETTPAVGGYIEFHLLLPGADVDETLILGEVKRKADEVAPDAFEIEFVCIAQDQTDRLVRYLLNRQRLDKGQRPLK